MSLEELKQDSEEFSKLLNVAVRSRVREKIAQLKAKTDRQILTLEMEVDDERPEKKKYYIELNEYAWDQSDKFVKLFITLNGEETIEEGDVEIDISDYAFKLLIRNLKGKDYEFKINNLVEPVDPIRSYHKIKKGMIAVYLKKVTEGKKWIELTTIQKRLKEQKENTWDGDSDNDEDPCMKIMKTLYNSGDSNVKAMIAKSWCEYQQKKDF